MNRYEVGYEDEMIGIYEGKDEIEAIQNCKLDMKLNNFKPDTPPKIRLLKGMIAVKIDYWKVVKMLASELIKELEKQISNPDIGDKEVYFWNGLEQVFEDLKQVYSVTGTINSIVLSGDDEWLK